MSWLSFLVPALLATGASAATCSVGTTTIKNQASASALALACRTFTGTIAIATGNTDPIDLTGIELVKKGGIRVTNNGNLPSLTSNTLQSIEDGSFYLDNVTQLSGLVFPVLTSVDVLHFNGLASLYGWNFTTTIQMASSVLISDTQVNTLTGLDLKTVDTLNIDNNNLLSEIDMQLSKITGGVIISQNSNPTVSFNDLLYAVNMTFTGVSSLSLGSLKLVNQTLGVYESSLRGFSAPKLTELGGLALVNSPQLATVSVPKLSIVNGALIIANDTSLGGELKFPALQQVHGAVKLAGSFTSVSMPQITNIRGTCKILSDKKLGDTCDTFENYHDKQHIIQGSVTCSGAQPTKSISKTGKGNGNGGTSSTSSSSGSSHSSNAAAKVDLAVPAVGGVIGLFLAILGML